VYRSSAVESPDVCASRAEEPDEGIGGIARDDLGVQLRARRAGGATDGAQQRVSRAIATIMGATSGHECAIGLNLLELNAFVRIW
jgi:hypothetical protein